MLGRAKFYSAPLPRLAKMCNPASWIHPKPILYLFIYLSYRKWPKDLVFQNQVLKLILISHVVAWVLQWFPLNTHSYPLWLLIHHNYMHHDNQNGTTSLVGDDSN